MNSMTEIEEIVCALFSNQSLCAQSKTITQIFVSPNPYKKLPNIGSVEPPKFSPADLGFPPTRFPPPIVVVKVSPKPPLLRPGKALKIK